MAQTIEKTGKRWKAIKAVGGAMTFVGGVAAIASADTMRWSVPLAVVGMLTILYANLGAWWNHG